VPAAPPLRDGDAAGFFGAGALAAGFFGEIGPGGVGSAAS
jgi:hypothetical protein